MLMILFNKFTNRILFIIFCFHYFKFKIIHKNKYKPISIGLLRLLTTIKNSFYDSTQSLCFNNHHPIKTYGENACTVPYISKPEIKGGNWSLSSLDISLPGQEPWWLMDTNFYILLTMHLSIILANNQLDVQILCFIISFITVLYMFRAMSCSSSGGEIVLIQHLVSSLSVGEHLVQRWESTLSSQPVHWTVTYRQWQYQMLY
jgi:hypothetical protein